MKNSLSEKDIKRISDKQRAEQAKRDEFESHVKVYMKTDEKYLTFALLHPRWPKGLKKKWSYYSLSYHTVDVDMVRESEGSVTVSEPAGSFKTYKEFKKFLKSSSLREPNEFELAKLKSSENYLGHFRVNDVESIELTEEEEDWLDSELGNEFE